MSPLSQPQSLPPTQSTERDEQVLGSAQLPCAIWRSQVTTWGTSVLLSELESCIQALDVLDIYILMKGSLKISIILNINHHIRFSQISAWKKKKSVWILSTHTPEHCQLLIFLKTLTITFVPHRNVDGSAWKHNWRLFSEYRPSLWSVLAFRLVQHFL